MAIIDGKQLDMEPIGAGLVGVMKVFFIVLAAGVAKTINFGKFKLSDVDNVHMVWGVGDNGSGDTYQGAPDTTLDVNAGGTGIVCEDAAGGDFAVSVCGTWTYK